MKRSSPLLIKRPTRLRDLRPNSYRKRLRAVARKAAIFACSIPARIPIHDEWVFFPYYHHVLDDERLGFDRQVKYFKRFGEFLSLDDAIDAMSDPAGIGGRYICITFDDGFRNCLTNALPILVENKCPAAFFVITDYVGLDLEENCSTIAQMFSDPGDPPQDFLTWDDCRVLLNAGMTIGAHTCSHIRAADVPLSKFEAELVASKRQVEKKLGAECRHLACPWGRPGVDFDPVVHPVEAQRAGFSSFLTTARGLNRVGTDAFSIRRDHCIAGDHNFVLRHFLSSGARAA